MRSSLLWQDQETHINTCSKSATKFHGGITEDLGRREQEHKAKWPKGHITPVGRRTTEDAARKWEEDKGFD